MEAFQSEAMTALITVFIFSILMGIVLGVIVPGYNDIMISIIETAAMY